MPTKAGLNGGSASQLLWGNPEVSHPRKMENGW